MTIEELRKQAALNLEQVYLDIKHLLFDAHRELYMTRSHLGDRTPEELTLGEAIKAISRLHKVQKDHLADAEAAATNTSEAVEPSAVSQSKPPSSSSGS